MIGYRFVHDHRAEIHQNNLSTKPGELQRNQEDDRNVVWLRGRAATGEDMNLTARDYALIVEQIQSDITFDRMLTDDYLTAWS